MSVYHLKSTVSLCYMSVVQFLKCMSDKTQHSNDFFSSEFSPVHDNSIIYFIYVYGRPLRMIDFKDILIHLPLEFEYTKLIFIFIKYKLLVR